MRNASVSRPSARSPVPPLRPVRPIGRRRAALGHPGHEMVVPSGCDGEIGVRYDAVHARAELAAGERRLLLAVLEDGIRTFLKNAYATRGRAYNLRREALHWLTARQRRDIFAFESICEALGIDAVRLRLRVLAAPAEEQTAVRGAAPA
jgi:hypothetical protein